MNTKLIEILKKETESLKTQYIELSVEYSEKEFGKLLKMTEWSYEEWKNQFPGGFTSFRGQRTQTLSKEGSNLKDRVSRFYANHRQFGDKFKIEFIEKAIKVAEDHYNYSILKLADRIEKKNLNIDKIQVKTSHIGVNIETVLTDGEKSVKAFTIIAGGIVQRPHYRYLIK